MTFQRIETDWLGDIGVKLDLHRWEYAREIAAESGKRSILITSPTRWILAYGPGYYFSQAVQSFAHRQDRRGIDQLRQFVVNALVIQALVSRSSGLISIFNELRYDVLAQPHPGLNGLPVVVIQSQIPTFLPPIRSLPLQPNCQVFNAFIELIEVEAVRQMPDPFKQRISQLIPE